VALAAALRDRDDLPVRELPTESFEPVDEGGMWVPREEVEPLDMETFSDLPRALANHGSNRA